MAKSKVVQVKPTATSTTTVTPYTPYQEWIRANAKTIDQIDRNSIPESGATKLVIRSLSLARILSIRVFRITKHDNVAPFFHNHDGEWQVEVTFEDQTVHTGLVKRDVDGYLFGIIDGQYVYLEPRP